jgi:hypothetical protein
LRFRIPFAPFCSKVTENEAHVLTITLDDGRTTGPMQYPDLVNVCTGQEDGDGSAWEQQWGMVQPASPPAAQEDAAANNAQTKKHKKHKRKKPKSKKKRKRKKKTRR